MKSDGRIGMFSTYISKFQDIIYKLSLSKISIRETSLFLFKIIRKNNKNLKPGLFTFNFLLFFTIRHVLENKKIKL